MMLNKEWYNLNKIIGDIYSDPIEDLFLNFCSNVKNFLFFDNSFSNLASDLNKKKYYFHYQSIDISNEHLQKYIEYYVELDYCAWYTTQNIDGIYKDSDLIAEEQRIKSQIYLEWLEPINLHYSCGMSIAKNMHYYGDITFLRSKEHGDFSDVDLEILKTLNRHLCCRLHQLFPNGINKNIFENNDSQNQCKYNLTSREYEIVKLLKNDNDTSELGGMLYISENTVKKHLSNIYKKLSVSNRSQFVKKIHDLD